MGVWYREYYKAGVCWLFTSTRWSVGDVTQHIHSTISLAVTSLRQRSLFWQRAVTLVWMAHSECWRHRLSKHPQPIHPHLRVDFSYLIAYSDELHKVMFEKG